MTAKGNNSGIKYNSLIIMVGIVLIVAIICVTVCVVSKYKHNNDVVPLSVQPTNHTRVQMTTTLAWMPPKFPQPPPRVKNDLFEELELPGLFIPPNDTTLNVKRVRFSEEDL